MRFLLFILCLFVAACQAIPSVVDRQKLAESLAQQRRWVGEDVKAGQFVLRSYNPANLAVAKMLSIYIEGDGLDQQRHAID